ncbi:MAG: hypothetical protein K0S61_894 [Anaerocolumna sp.]|jgi:hypothetical protein|nr:hypothetical protein [Anaerocolumna sp.]
MLRFRKIILPSISITFMLSILISVVWNVILGNTENTYFNFIIQLFSFLILVQIIDFFISKINYRNYFGYFATANIIYFIVYMTFGYFFHWFGFRLINIIINTSSFIIVTTFIHYHFHRLFQLEAEEINRLIDSRNQKI